MDAAKTQVTEAIFANGVLKPLNGLKLREQQRVRITVEAIEAPSETDRQAALQRLQQRIDRMNFRSAGPFPTRDELHERR